MKFVRHADNVTVAHHRVLGMNSIPSGYMILAAVWDACAEAGSQLVASGAGENETKWPSSVDDNEWRDMHKDEELPPSSPDEVHIGNPHQDADCPSQLETQTMSDVETPPARDLHTLELDIRKPPPSKELIQRMSVIIQAPLPTSKGVGPIGKKVPTSP